MKELDDLKEIWAQPSAHDVQWSREQLQEVLKGKSRTIIDRLKRSMWLEITMTYLALILLMLQAGYQQAGPIRWLMVMLFVFFAGFGIYFASRIWLLARFDFGAANLRDNLIVLIHKLDGFLNVYTFSNRLSLAVFYVLGLLAVYLEKGPEQIMAFVASPRGALFLVSFSVAMLAPIFLVNWVVDKLYGKHVERLRKLLADFEPN